ncbi:unnamed protein product [Calicophoron daubneyi]|uniref:Uncharacterized protein n=1 Tax=Calicophoron daubneyi TaxID=300641 RepID=A0AAV2T486_CALDB
MLNEFSRPPDALRCLGEPPKSLQRHCLRSCEQPWTWSDLDDQKLLDQVSRLGENRWNLVGKNLGRPSFHCYERYVRVLRPQLTGGANPSVRLLQENNVNRDEFPVSSSPWSRQENEVLIHLYYMYGPDWELIARRLSVINGSNGICRVHSPAEVRRQFEQILRTNNSCGQENRLPLNDVYQNALLSWSGSAKRKSKVYSEGNISEGPSTKSVESCEANQLISCYETTDETSTLKVRLMECNLEAPDNKSQTTTISLLSQITVQKSTSSDRLTISLPRIPDSRANELTSLPLIRLPNSLSSFPTEKREDSTEKCCTNQSGLIPRLSYIYTRPNRTGTFGENLSHKDDKSALFLHSHSISNIIGLQNEDAYPVQTPTKDLSEADQLSFHLASPPVILGSPAAAGISAPVRCAGFKRSADVDATPIRSDAFFSHSGQNDRRPVCTRLFDASGNSSAGRIVQLSNHLALSSPHAASDWSTAGPKTQIPTSSDSECLALLTAKATVWKRALSVPQANSNQGSNQSKTQTVPEPHHSGSVWPHVSSAGQLDLPGWRDPPSLFPVRPLTPLVPLKVHSRLQPYLSTRRVIQIGSENQWRRFALGSSKAHRTTTRLARRFLDQQRSYRTLSSATTSLENEQISPLPEVVKPEPPSFESEFDPFITLPSSSPLNVFKISSPH